MYDQPDVSVGLYDQPDVEAVIKKSNQTIQGPLNEAGRLMARRVRQMTIEQSMLVSISFWLTVFLPAVGAPMAATWQKPDWAAIVLLNFPDR